MITKPSVALWLDTRRSKKDDKYPVKVRIIHKRIPYYYPTNINLAETEFNAALSSKPGNKLVTVHLKLNELERQARKVIDKITDELHLDFSIELFEKYLLIGSSDYTEVFNCFQRKIDELKEREQLKTAIGYETSLHSFKNYSNRERLAFHEVDKNFLEGFESFMLKRKKSLTTISVYTRNLRTIYNEAIDEQVVNAELYPFGKNKYQIPQPANNKRALGNADLIKLFQYQPEENSWEEYAKDMWTLSLVCQGMNMKDIANLKFKNIQDDKIVFVREKTKRTKKSGQAPIVVYLDDTAKNIITKWANDGTAPNQFVFPIYNNDNTALQNLRNVEQQIKMINKYMRKIAKTLEIKQDVTFYAARHSFATTLKRQGRSIEEIQEFLGHQDKKTTERYLASFGDDHKRSIMTNFVKQLKKA